MAKRAKSRAKRLPEEPTCNCILLCEDVLLSGRGKHLLHGIISVIWANETPMVFGPSVAYVRIGIVYGQQTVRVSMERDEDQETLFAFDAKLDGQADPLGLHILIVPIPPFRIASAGRYRFEVAGPSGVPLATSPIMVMLPKIQRTD